MFCKISSIPSRQSKSKFILSSIYSHIFRPRSQLDDTVASAAASAATAAAAASVSDSAPLAYSHLPLLLFVVAVNCYLDNDDDNDNGYLRDKLALVDVARVNVGE